VGSRSAPQALAKHPLPIRRCQNKSAPGCSPQARSFFLARCARCHNEHGDKPLKTGPPLNERVLSTEEIARAVNGRLRDKTGEERRE
jgi:cytochrome c553